MSPPPVSAARGQWRCLKALQTARSCARSHTLAGARFILRNGGYALPADDIYAWALSNGWSARGAQRLRDFGERIDAGRTVQLKGTSPLAEDSLTRWWARAADEET